MVDYSVNKTHCVAFASKTLAALGGKHIYNVRLTNACDNGNFIARDAWLGLDLYSEKAATKFEGIVREQAANGTGWYVEVTDPGDALFVQMPVVGEEEWTMDFKSEAAWYNPAGSVVRAYELAVGDILEISDAGFTAKPVLVADTDYEVELSGKKLAKVSTTL